ncbi:MAG TPA: hypothetical protein VHB25_14260 [Gemmatimonadaceae bacterium]|nr:hypothetical protein [Gemmatimonadaceae bacterium]
MFADHDAWDTRATSATRIYVSHGVSVGVRTNDPSLLDRVADCFPPDSVESPSAEADAWYSIVRSPAQHASYARYELFRDEQKLNEGLRLAPLLDRMDAAIRVDVGRRAPEQLFVHAGAVAWNGRVIVLPGRSGAGKTTLVAALVRAGAAYCSDEYAVLDRRGYVHPYPRRLSMRQGGNRRVRWSAVTDLGGEQADAPLPVGAVVVTRYEPGARWAPRALSAGESALALFANTLIARDKPAFAFAVLSRAVAGVISTEGDRGEADATAAAILAFVDQTYPSTQGTTP